MRRWLTTFFHAGVALLLFAVLILQLTRPAWTPADQVQSAVLLVTLGLVTLHARRLCRDLAHDRQLLLTLLSEGRFTRQVMYSAGQGIAFTDQNSEFTYVNPAFAQMLGRPVRELLGRKLEELTLPEDLDVLAGLNETCANGQPGTCQVRLCHASSSEVFVQLTCTPHSQGGTLVMITDVSGLHHAQRHLAQEAAYARALVSVTQLSQHASDPTGTATRAAEIIASVADGEWAGILHVNGDTSTVETVFDSQRGTRSFRQFVESQPVTRPVGGVWRAVDENASVYADEYEQTHGVSRESVQLGLKSAAWIPVWREGHEVLLFSFVRLGTARWWTSRDRDLIEAAASSVRLAFERQAHLRTLERYALEDPLCGLGNRRAFEQSLALLVDRAARHDETFSLIMMDLDGLKRVNDQHGHAVGDALLRSFAQDLRRRVRAHDLVFRIGGDEFALLMPRASHAGRCCWNAWSGPRRPCGKLGSLPEFPRGWRASRKTLEARKRWWSWRTSGCTRTSAASTAGRKYGRPCTYVRTTAGSRVARSARFVLAVAV